LLVQGLCIALGFRSQFIAETFAYDNMLCACFHVFRYRCCCCCCCCLVLSVCLLARDAQAKLALIVAQILSICPSVCLSVRNLSAALRVASHIDYRLVFLIIFSRLHHPAAFILTYSAYQRSHNPLRMMSSGWLANRRCCCICYSFLWKNTHN